MSKIVKFDSEQLSNFKWNKCPLGVIHPEHTPMTKTDANDSFSDLIVTAKPAYFNFKSAYVPPAAVTVKRETSPHRRPKSSKPGIDVVGEALKSIPEARSDRKSFMRTSLIAGKDLRNSLTDYKSNLSNKKLEVKNNKRSKFNYHQEVEKIDYLLGEKFKSNKLSDSEYTEIRQEILKLRSEYESQLWKQKYIINFLAVKEKQLDLQELNRMYTEIQLKKEKQLITIQHFVLKLREITVTQARSLIAYVSVENIRRILGEFSRGTIDEREILVEFMEKVKIQLHKDGLDKESEESMPFGVLEKTISSIFTKWEREKFTLEAFIGDIMSAFCEEFNLSKEAVLHDKPKNKREMELRVVAEFINMYLQRLHNSIDSKINSLERVKQVIEHGKQVPASLSEVLLKFIKLPDKKPIPGSAPIKKTDPKNDSRSKSRSKSPKLKPHSTYLKKSAVKPGASKTNVGKNTKSYSSTKLSSIPEERKRSPVGISRKNPLDSVSSLNASLDEEGMDDIISDLNPARNSNPPIDTNKINLFKKPTDQFRKPEMDSTEGLFHPSKNSSKPQVDAKKINLFKKPAEQSRKSEMDSTEGLFNFRPNKVFKPTEVFSSIEAPLHQQAPDHRSTDFVYKSISDLESMKYPKKPPESRSELIMSGVKPFHPYMDKDGSVFDPHEKFPHIKAADVDPLDPYFLEEIGNRSPDPSTDWYLRSHHLRSFTNHPLSVNDNPNFYKAPMQSSLDQAPDSQPVDQRDVAIMHLEKTLEDLRCELESRRRVAAVNSFAGMENRFTGNLPRAINPVAQGLNIAEKEGLVLHTYEGILDELRAREKDILNQKRAVEYENNRPPQGKWFELKTNEFTQEIHRHMSSLQPKEQHKRLLNHLAIPDLY